MFTTRFLDIPPLARRRRHGARAGLEEHLEPRPAARRLRRGHDDDRRACSHSDDTQVMLEALTQLGCRIEGDGDAARRHRPRRVGPLTQQPTLLLGNAGTAMRPLAAALALVAATPARASSCAARRACTSGRSATWSTRCARSAARSTTSAADGFPPLRVARRRRRRSRSTAPIVVRGDVSSQFLTALLLALPLRAEPRRRGRSRSTGELISKPYVEITLKPARALRRRRRARRLAALSRSRAGQALRSPGRFLVEGDASSASYFIAAGGDRRARRAAAHRGRRQRLDPGRHRLRRRRARDGRDDRDRAAPRWSVRRGRLPLAPIDARLQPHPRRGDDAGRAGPVRRRHRRA